MSEKSEITQKLIDMDVAKNYSTSDVGAGAIFANVFKDKIRYNPTIKEFMVFDGVRWVKDTEGMEARRRAKLLSDCLLTYTAQADLADDKRQGFFKWVCGLAYLRARNNMLQDAKDIFYIDNNLLDGDKSKFNCVNCTLDFSNGGVKALKHNPNMLISKVSGVSYDPKAKAPLWEKYLNEIMLGNENKIKYLQKIAGMSLTGETYEECLFILLGRDTRNGKSTFVETLGKMYGDYAATMNPESLAQRQNKDARQASGDIARLKGVRFLNVSEPPKRMIFDVALLKTLVGRDTITARHLHEREFQFIPEFKLVINTNHLPLILDDTVFSSGRIKVVEFLRHFEDEEQDKHLKDKLLQAEELSGILNWCIDGLELYRREGLGSPQEIVQATEDYRQQSDKIGSFIDECLEKSDSNTTAKDVYEAYGRWCDSSGFAAENKQNFFGELRNKNLLFKSGTVGTKTVKNVVKGYVINPNKNDTEDLPFS